MNETKIIKLVILVVIIGVLYFLLFNNVYLVDMNILYIKITIIEKMKKISGIKNNKSREIKVVNIIIIYFIKIGVYYNLYRF